MTAPTAITSLARALSEWADRPANERFLRVDQEAQLRQSLDDPRRRPQVHVAAWMLGTWHLGHGFVRVLRGEGRGFDEARVGQALRRSSLLLRERHDAGARRPGRGPAARLPFSLLQGTMTALLGLALHDPGAEPLYERIVRLPDSAFGEGDELALFTRELLVLREGRRANVTPRLGAYEDVLRHWHGDERLLARAQADVLDLHVQQVRVAGSGFDDPACQLYPLEVLATRAVRTLLGLPAPKVEHALLFTNLATMQPDPAWPADERTTKLERLLRQR